MVKNGILVVLLLISAQAERLPVKSYTVADGLPGNRIHRIRRDSRGFLWFCTSEGLARFDGYQFTNFTPDSGLPTRSVNDLLETRDHTYLLATNDGVVTFNPLAIGLGSGSPSKPKSKFVLSRIGTSHLAQQVSVLLEDRRGTIWCATAGGLYGLKRADGEWVPEPLEMGMPAAPIAGVRSLLEDHQGTLWIGTENGLYRLWPDGRINWLTTAQGLPSNWIGPLIEDRRGQIWAGASNSLCRLTSQPNREGPLIEIFSAANGLPPNEIESLFETSDGRLWVGMLRGFGEFVGGEGVTKFRSYTTAQGVNDRGVFAMEQDRAENLWLGTEASGVMRIVRAGFTTYTDHDGLRPFGAMSLLTNKTGELLALNIDRPYISRFEGRQFSTLRINVPKTIELFGWGENQITFQDHNGEWWVATAQGLVRFPKVSRLEQLAHVNPKAIYTTKNGLPGNVILRLFEDSQGDIWVGTHELVGSIFGGSTIQSRGGARWDRSTGTFHKVPGPVEQSIPMSFCEDRFGQVWIGFSPEGLARYKNGHFTYFTATDGVPRGMITALHQNTSGTLWIASTSGGLSRIDDTSIERPKFAPYTTKQGLSSNRVLCLTEDRRGRIYAGTARGIDRIDPLHGRTTHYGEAEGAPAEEPVAALCDRNGTIWFATGAGLARIEPQEDRRVPPVRPIITALRIAGVPYPTSDLGESRISGLKLASHENNLAIDFASLRFAPGEILQYQYRLDGAEEGWSASTDQRNIHYANLSPGAYRFRVRSITGEGIPSKEEATIQFDISAPVWRRWYFQTFIVIAGALMLYAAYRRRLGRLLELERVRTRLATDLHDDIGSGLAEIAILTEVAKSHSTPAGAALLTDVADCARSLRESMGDIVWAVDPRKDNLADLVRRMKQTAYNLLEADGRSVEFDAPLDAEIKDIALTSDRRRHLLFIVKEALTNVVRHAGATNVLVRIRLQDSALLLIVKDDGCGFDSRRSYDGNGLQNLKRRTDELHAKLTIDSALGRGTVVEILAPFKFPR